MKSEGRKTEGWKGGRTEGRKVERYKDKGEGRKREGKIGRVKISDSWSSAQMKWSLRQKLTLRIKQEIEMEHWYPNL
jgi:hypothetical protein